METDCKNFPEDLYDSSSKTKSEELSGGHYQQIHASFSGEELPEESEVLSLEEMSDSDLNVIVMEDQTQYSLNDHLIMGHDKPTLDGTHIRFPCCQGCSRQHFKQALKNPYASSERLQHEVYLNEPPEIAQHRNSWLSDIIRQGSTSLANVLLEYSSSDSEDGETALPTPPSSPPPTNFKDQ
ncbi:hypothetical protein M422DRAFT_241713 [Sphaerobolus stellatus SS14]|nr:hypothetical protein M422DRAFT_241713 [Sphaerobolus stellatus SS14]